MTTPDPVEWTVAEREALEAIAYGTYRAQDEAYTELARLIADREREAKAAALREAADDLPESSLDRPVGTWLHQRADRIEREGQGDE